LAQKSPFRAVFDIYPYPKLSIASLTLVPDVIHQRANLGVRARGREAFFSLRFSGWASRISLPSFLGLKTCILVLCFFRTPELDTSDLCFSLSVISEGRLPRAS